MPTLNILTRNLVRSTTLLCLASFSSLAASTEVTVDPTAEHLAISPFIYGKNNNLSSDPEKPVSEEQWKKLKDAGITFFSESGGNNSTKYNWEKKQTSHPDWYNNVHGSDWDYAVQSLDEIK